MSATADRAVIFLWLIAGCSVSEEGVCVPSGAEACGGGDEDCDGWVDDADAPVEGRATWYLDMDGDGHGNPGLPWLACVRPAAASAEGDDCDDGDASVDARVWYIDEDGDGFGETATAVAACAAPSGASSEPGDCDDSDPARSPSAVETCAAGDEDCDGLEDDADPSLTGAPTWYPDADADGFGDADAVQTGCTPEGVDLGGDCDDADPATNPLARDTCDDGVDQDCDAGDRACALLGAWDLDASDVHFQSTSAGFGSSVAFVGDVDGDGRGDVGFGALRHSGSRGAALVVRGPWSADVDVEVDASIWEGMEANDEAGTAVIGAGDTDADGLADVFVGAPGEAPNQTGAAYLLSGASLSGSGFASLADATAVVPGLYEWDAMGGALGVCGDLDGDGRDDLILGSPFGSLHAGAFAVLPATAMSGTVDVAPLVRVDGALGDHLAGSIDGAGDFDGDGLADLIVGAEAEAGAAFVVLGPIDTPGAIEELAALSLFGEEPFDEAGTSVAGVGDIDGDGRDDVLVGAPNNGRGGVGGGTAYVITGPASGESSLADATAILPGARADDRTGYAVAGGGDVDGDGFADILVGAPGDVSAGYDTGGAWLAYGPLAGLVTLGDSTMAHFSGVGAAGSTVAMGGDVDGDGRADLLFGADHTDSVWLVLGQPR